MTTTVSPGRPVTATTAASATSSSATAFPSAPSPRQTATSSSMATSAPTSVRLAGSRTTWRLTPSITAYFANDRARVAAMTLYYVATVAALVALYGSGSFSPPAFVYQG